MKKIINTPEGIIEVDLTSEEIAQRQIDLQQELEKKEAKEKARLERLSKEEQEKANKQSALNKLKALGLTEAEIKAIIG